MDKPGRHRCHRHKVIEQIIAYIRACRKGKGRRYAAAVQPCRNFFRRQGRPVCRRPFITAERQRRICLSPIVGRAGIPGVHRKNLRCDRSPSGSHPQADHPVRYGFRHCCFQSNAAASEFHRQHSFANRDLFPVHRNFRRQRFHGRKRRIDAVSAERFKSSYKNFHKNLRCQA